MFETAKKKIVEFFKRDRLHEWLVAVLAEAMRPPRAPAKSGDIGIKAAGEFVALDGLGVARYFKTADGTGASGSPWIPLHSVDDNGGSLTVDGTVTANAGTNLNTSALALETTATSIKNAVEVLDNAIAGTEMQVDVLTLPNVTIGAAIPAGANNIGDVDVLTIAAGDNNIGNVDIVTVPADPFGANADAASATGSISAKLRFIAATGIPVTAVTPGTSSGNLGKQEDAAHASGDTGVMLLGVRNTTHASLADAAGDYTPINVDAEGCVVVVGNVAHDAVDADPPIKIGGKAATSAPSAVAANDRVNAYFDTNGRQAVFADTQLPAALAAGGGLKIEGVAGGVAVPISAASLPSHAVTNAGTFAVQVDGNALTALQLIDDPVIADDAAFTPATSKVMMAGFEADEASTDSVDEGDAGAARMTLDRKQIVNPQPHTAGGLSIANFTSGDTYTALTNGAQAIKASAGQIYGYYIYNPNSSAAYVMVYNIASASVTVGTSTALLVFCIPATSAANLALPFGITFDTAISCAAATTGGGNGAPSTALEAMFWYK